ncbi:ABC transporter permease [Vagococcus elongatus]|uniref:ABC transporter permease n=1 Tax=Vagococcus elongatus TaxID=180344 RepID=A0A430AMW2_9ENTE|nr:ABC transporter permease subunit [Vagococcus elongatus]RSU09458.1 hypothetical protein CBF29_11460 [Vagococcus elongatus]
MIGLIKNELIKLFSRKSSWGMQIILVLCMFAMAFMFTKSNESMKQYYKEDGVVEFNGGMTAYKKSDGTLLTEDEYWQSDDIGEAEVAEVSLTLDETIDFLNNKLENYQDKPKVHEKELLKSTKKQLEYYQAYHDRGITPPNPQEGSTSAFFFSLFGQIYVLPTLFSVVVASMIIAAEFTSGTIKLLLIRPYTRIQILWSKYFVTLIYGVLSSLVMAASAFLFSFMLPSQPLNAPLDVMTGAKTALTVAGQLFASNFLLMILYITIAFFFSAVIRSQALAVGVGMGILFSGSILGQVLPAIIEKYDWLKWIIFNLLGLNNQVIDASYYVGGNLSITATVVGIIAYIIVIYAATLFLFNKRDVALT